jgi:hypothetical protein
MILIVTGSRGMNPVSARDAIKDYLRKIEKVVIYHGNSGNVDMAAKAIGDMWSGYSQVPFDADWKDYGRAAGPVRNETMVQVALEVAKTTGDTVKGLAIWNGSSKGTKDCIERMKKAGIEVETIVINETTKAIDAILGAG